MHRIARAASIFVISSLFIAVRPARALDIVLTNDDGFESALTYALYQRLLEAGHRVLISASTADQSGRGGSVDFLRPIGPLTAATRGGCVVPPASPPTPAVGNLGLGAPFVVTDCPSDPNVFWVSGTPVASALHGIDVAARARFGKAADLVISGPNFGNNTGLVNNSSGTVNAALIALNRGIPAIAVSVANPTSYRSFRTGLEPLDLENADVIVRLVAAVEAGGRHGELLPAGTGLNVNLPRFEPGTSSTLSYQLSNVGLATSATPIFDADLCANAIAGPLLGAACAGPNPPKLAGVAIVPSGAQFPSGLSSLPDDNADSEQNVVNAGDIAISVIEGTHQATRDMRQRVAAGLQRLLSPGHAR